MDRQLISLLFAMGACGCKQLPPGPGDGGMAHYPGEVLSAVVRDNPDNVVSALVDVTARHGDTVCIEYGDTTDYEHRSADYLVPDEGQLTVPVLGLRPAAQSHIKLTAYHPDGSSVSSADILFDTPPLPDDLPTFKASAGPHPMGGAILLGLLQFPHNFALAAMVDHEGRLLWYRRAQPSALGLDFQRQSNGHFTVFQSGPGAFEELDLAGNVLRQWTSPLAGGGINGHEMLILPGDHALLLGRELHTVDTRPYDNGGVADALAYKTTIDEVTPEGRVTFHWDSSLSMGLDEVDADVKLEGDGFDPIQPTAISVLPDGNLLASFRATSSLVKIDRHSGKVMWRLGGKKSDFQFIADAQNGFSHQLDARMLDNGDLLVFDGGSLHPAPASRVAQYRLDPVNHAATLVWEYRHVPALLSDGAGSARRLANGNTVVAWGTQGLVTEIDPFASVLWELSVANTVVFRAIPVPSVYP